MSSNPITQLNTIDTSLTPKKLLCADCGSPNITRTKVKGRPAEYNCNDCPSTKAPRRGYAQNVFAKETRVAHKSHDIPYGSQGSIENEGCFMGDLVKEFLRSKKKYEATDKELKIKAILDKVWPRIKDSTRVDAFASLERLRPELGVHEIDCILHEMIRIVLRDSHGVGVKVKHKKIAVFFDLNPRAFEKRNKNDAPPLRRFLEEVSDILKAL